MSTGSTREITSNTWSMPAVNAVRSSPSSPLTKLSAVDDGMINTLVWFALEDYETHTFSYHDDPPNQEMLQRFIFRSPSRKEMSKFNFRLRKQYGVYRELEIARLLELPDIYQPQMGERPRANFGVCHQPGDDRIVSGISGTPRIREQEIFEDVDKIVLTRR